MISNRDGHVRVLPLHVANKIAAGEVVERPASVVKELVENALDAGARKISVSVTQGGRKLIAVQDDGCGMTKDDAVLSLERQATSKIRDVTDIEEIDTLGFRGEAIPSIASVSRFTLTTRRADDDEGTLIQVNAGILAEVRTAGCPPGTLVEVRDLFCNVPARRKFLRSYATEESHVREVFTVHALAHPSVGFSLSVDGRELYRLAPADNLADRIRELFGDEFLANALTLGGNQTFGHSNIHVSGLIEMPNLSTPTRRDQYVFVNGRPATSASIAYALREAYQRRAGDTRPAAVIFIELPPNQVDVNVHPTKREVRFRDNVAVKSAIMEAIGEALNNRPATATLPIGDCSSEHSSIATSEHPSPAASASPKAGQELSANDQKLRHLDAPMNNRIPAQVPLKRDCPAASPVPQPVPVETEFVLSDDGKRSKPWQWFKFLAQSASGYLLVETDSGIVTINPHAARERIAYEKLLQTSNAKPQTSNVQPLLIPETVHLSPVDAARIKASLPTIVAMGF